MIYQQESNINQLKEIWQYEFIARTRKNGLQRKADDEQQRSGKEHGM